MQRKEAFNEEGGHPSNEIRFSSRPYYYGAKIGNWFEDFAVQNREQKEAPAGNETFRTMYSEQNKLLETKTRSYMDKTFIHDVAKEPFPKSESQDAYKAPAEQVPRTFKSQRHFNTSEEAADHYITRWTKGTVGETQYKTVHRDFWKK